MNDMGRLRHARCADVHPYRLRQGGLSLPRYVRAGVARVILIPTRAASLGIGDRLAWRRPSRLGHRYASHRQLSGD